MLIEFNTQKEEFISLVKENFMKCKTIGVNLEPSIEEFLMSYLPKCDSVKEMTNTVVSYFDDPSTYDTAQCAGLFMDAMSSYQDADL